MVTLFSSSGYCGANNEVIFRLKKARVGRQIPDFRNTTTGTTMR